MITTLESLQNTTRPYQRRKTVGRGPGSRRGKTSTRGHKGAGSRSGYKIRAGYLGGGVPLHRRLPTRGFSNARFARRLDAINLGQIEAYYKDGETVSLETLRDKGLIKNCTNGVKILGSGDLKKKVKLQVEAISNSAKEKLKMAGIAI